MRVLNRSIGMISATLLAVSAPAGADMFITTSNSNGLDNNAIRLLDNGTQVWTALQIGGEGVYGVAVDSTGTSYAVGFALGWGSIYKLAPGGGRLGWSTFPSNVWQPSGLTVTSDGSLYALRGMAGGSELGEAAAGVVRFDSQTGANRSNFISLTSVFIDRLRDIASDDAGHLFISQWSRAGGNRILRIGIDQLFGAPVAGELTDPFIPAGRGGLIAPARLTIGPDRKLYVADAGLGTVLKYDPDSGAYLGAAVTGANPATITDWSDLAFVGSDLLISSGSSVYRFNGTTGAYVGVFATVPGRVISSMASGVPEPAAAATIIGAAAITLLRRRARHAAS